MGTHTSHVRVVNRLQRARGHLESVIEMIKNEKPCLEVAQQLHAVSNAIFNAKKVYINDHIDHCFDHAVSSRPDKLKISIEEFKEITKYLD